MPELRRGTALTGVLVAVGVAVLVWLAVAAGETSGWLHAFDVDADEAINRRIAGHHTLVRCWQVVTTVGTPLTWRVLAAVAAVVLWLRGRRVDAVLVVVVMTAALVVSSVVKVVVDRPRPTVPTPTEHVAGGSFPSGHALTSAAGFGLVLVLTTSLSAWRRRTVCVIVGTGALLVAASRLALGVHYPTDVVGGWLFAALLVLLGRVAVRRRRRRPAG